MLEQCLKEDRKAQQALYDRYAPILLGICRRYIRSDEDAEDVMIEGFFKIFRNLRQFDRRGSFEGWMKKIMVNEALMWLRKKRLPQSELDEKLPLIQEDTDLRQFELEGSEIIPLLDQLPDGYRTVFNLYVMEELKHREIAVMLGISINTSKSQLILAKKKLKQLILEKQTKTQNKS
ncbi:MAG TPA: sigma-70 family RNA polymerase sigma factor [Saprospiraceae bacterium]|nr:sigma-70 family RNA polymerase sigma factor [Saprospiraceae bacterium]HNT21982.1 sigma-70 family RNA polymerase sigma factor [Saprospiraceae bacterium]